MIKRFRPLVYTDTFAAGELPHLILTGLDDVQNLYDALVSRENKYGDVAGILSWTRENQELDDQDVEIAETAVLKLNKSIVYLVETDIITGHLFFRDEVYEEIVCKPLKARTNNDVNFDVWHEDQNHLWNPVEFLLDGVDDLDVYNASDKRHEEIKKILQDTNTKIEQMGNRINTIEKIIKRARYV